MTAHHFHLERGDGRIVLAVTGAIDAETVFDLRGTLQAQTLEAGTSVEIDLSSTEFMDSSGLGFLVGLARRAQREKWTFSLSGASGQVQRLLQRVGWPTTLES